ncbi:hypothetical protein ACVDFE_12755 [Lentzea chajnantorensis]
MRAAPLLALAALTALATAASATPLELPGHDRDGIAALAQRYLENRARKVTTGPQTPGFGVPLTPALAAELRTHEEELAAARTSWSHRRTRYRSAVVRTEVTRFDVQHRDLVVAHVREAGELHFDRPGTVPATGYGLLHHLTVRRENGDWVLAGVAVEHSEACGLLPEPQAVTCTG